MSEKRKLRIRDDEQVREIFANQMLGTIFDGSTITCTFGTTRALPEFAGDEPGKMAQPQVYVTARLSLTPKAAAELVNALNVMLTALQQKNAPKPPQAVSH